MTNDYSAESVQARIETLYHTESRRILATLIRLLGDFELAEEALQEAFKSALEQWPVQGIPTNPRAWLISTGRFKAIDTLRRARPLRSRLSIARRFPGRNLERPNRTGRRAFGR